MLRNENFDPAFLFEDPRNDSGVFGSLDIKSGPMASLNVQYGISKLFVVEGSIAYSKADLGDVALDVAFFGNPPPILEIPFNFTSFRVPVGDLTQVPIQLTALARFRPRASFNPYFGAGIGYIIQGVSLTDEFNELSYNMDAARGTQMRVPRCGSCKAKSPSWGSIPCASSGT